MTVVGLYDTGPRSLGRLNVKFAIGKFLSSQEKKKIIDIIEYTPKQKWRWAGHIARMKDNRWTKRCSVATKEREETKRTTKQKMARRHNKEGEDHLEQESNSQKTMEDIDGGLHPIVDGQSLGESEKIFPQSAVTGRLLAMPV